MNNATYNKQIKKFFTVKAINHITIKDNDINTITLKTNKTHERLTYKQNREKEISIELRRYAHENYNYKDAIEFIRITNRQAE